MPAPLLSKITNPRKFAYGLALDDRLFRLATGPGRQVTYETDDPTPPRIDTASNAQELASKDPVFARSRFSGGEGLFRAHEPGAAEDRFWDSKNVSVSPAEPGEFPEIRLLHATESIESSASTGLYVAYDASAGALYVCEGTVLRRSADPTASSPTFADDDPHDGETATTVEDVAVLGDEVYAALGANGIHKKTSSTWAHWGDNPTGEEYERLWSVKGRIVASTGDSLYELGTAGGAAPSALHILASGETWQDVCDGGDFVLAAASDGYVYAFSTDTGSLVLAAQSLFEGETPRSVGQTQGVVAVGTSDGNTGRLYVGGLAETGQIVDQQFIKQWGTTGGSTDQSPRTILGGLRESLFMATTDGTDTFLWRYDVRTGGLSRSYSIDGETGLTFGIAAIDGEVFASVDGAGLFRQADTYASSGYLMSPLGDFLTSDDKSWVGARLETGDLSAGTVAELYYTTDPDALSDPDASAWIRVTRRETGTGDTGEMSLNNAVSRSLAMMVKLKPSTDAASTPAVRSFGVRAYAASEDDDVIVTLPVNISDQVERFGRSRARIPGRGTRERTALLAFEKKPVLARVLSDDLLIRGLVEKVNIPRQTERRRGSPTVIAQVRIRGKVVGQSGSTSGAGALGTAHLIGTPPTLGKVA